MSETDVLIPNSEPVKLESGMLVTIEEMRTRQFLRMLKIVTRGALPLISDPAMLRISDDVSKEVFTARIISLLLAAFPEAEDETISFLQSMVSPHGLIEKSVLQESDIVANKKKWAELDAELANPRLGDTVTLIEAIVQREASDLQALGKRIAAMFKVAQKTGQVPESLNQMFQGENSSDQLAAPSTSSSVPTASPMMNA